VLFCGVELSGVDISYYILYWQYYFFRKY
jgi:hypothetical protein